MIHRITGKIIPETFKECQNIQCVNCEFCPLVPKGRSGDHLYVKITECLVRRLMYERLEFEGLLARPKLLKFVHHLLDGIIKEEIYNEIVERTKAIITEQGEQFKILGVLRGRVISIDCGRKEFWWIPQIHKTRRSFRIGWLWWALYTLRFTEDKDE